ncbi:MAG: glycosyltransferase [Verrucomicrobia bacterium]|nr:glycosyltransferase [Verrucomicrobiota bacterium]
MIVKNESPVIKRCLDSIKNRIDYWVISDTGSTDGTQALIREILQDIPGELHENPWVDFAHNRNIALNLAKNKADYLLFLDADQVLKIPDGANFPPLTKDCYYVQVQSDFRYSAHYILLIKSSLNMAWKGVIHEALTSDAKSHAIFSEIEVNAYSDGNRSRDPDKFKKDAALLEKALEEDPTNQRDLMFLALSYDAAKQPEKALKVYEKRASLGGWEEEVFYCLLRTAHLQRSLGMAPEIFLASYEKAYAYRPSRAETLYWMADYYISIQEFQKAYDLVKKALFIPFPIKDVIYVEPSIYRYELLLSYVRCSYQTGRYRETLEALQKLLTIPNLPEMKRLQVEDILPHVKEKANLL